MPKEPNRPPPQQDQAPEGAQPPNVPPPDALGELFTRRRLAVLLCVSVLLHVVGYSYHRLLLSACAQAAPDAELALGVFRYEGDRVEGGRVARAEFSVHIALCDPADRSVRALLAARRYRIQQGVEELLRRAHGGDFEDPVLAGLKRKIRDRIDESLEGRVVSDVIITDLKLQWNPPQPAPAADRAETNPWPERPAG